MKKYNRTPIGELDKRQCIYTDYNKNCTNLLINGKSSIDIMEEEVGEDLSPGEVRILEENPDREAYRWINMRGATIVFRTEQNENTFKWHELKKLQ